MAELAAYVMLAPSPILLRSSVRTHFFSLGQKKVNLQNVSFFFYSFLLFLFSLFSPFRNSRSNIFPGSTHDEDRMISSTHKTLAQYVGQNAFTVDHPSSPFTLAPPLADDCADYALPPPPLPPPHATNQQYAMQFNSTLTFSTPTGICQPLIIDIAGRKKHGSRGSNVMQLSIQSGLKIKM